MLSHEPLLFEGLVGRPEDLLTPGIGWTFLRSSDLRRYRTYNEFKSVLRFIVGEISTRGLHDELSLLAGGILVDALRRGRAEISGGEEVSIALIALGKLGGSEISVGSDLDVILFYQEGSTSADAKIVNAVGRRLLEILEGVYEIDLRLRPEGTSAPLATEFGYYKEYLNSRASLWERQSLLKARFIGGDEMFGRGVINHLADFAYRAPLPKQWKIEILKMRHRIVQERSRGGGSNLKVGIGGLVDLEFSVQALQLRFGAHSDMLVQTNTYEALSALGDQRFLKSNAIATIRRNLEYLRRVEAYVRINSEATDFVLPPQRNRLQAIVSAMESASPKSFRNTLRKTRKINRTLFSAIVRSLPR